MPPPMRPARLTAALLILAAAASLAGCGNKPRIRTEAENEGVYLNVGPLTYQVQISRQLNPNDVEDRTYLQNVPPALKRLAPGQTWFGIFVRVANETKQAHPAASRFVIVDTQRRRYLPVAQLPGNPFVYHAGPLPAGQTIPGPNSVAGEGVIQGSLVLFKLTYGTLDNRPLLLRITDPQDNEGVVKLDV
jgi:hypothetical protein